MALRTLILAVTTLWITNLSAKADQLAVHINPQSEVTADIQQSTGKNSAEQEKPTTPIELKQQESVAEPTQTTKETATPAANEDHSTSGTPQSSKDQWRLSDDLKTHAFGISIGTFHHGYYSIYDGTTNSFRACSAWTFCGDGLFGGIGTIDVTKRLFKAGSFNFDIDASGSIGHQNIVKSWYKPIPSTDQSRTFGLISIVPTIRVRFGGALRPLRFGLGAGLSYAIGSIPYEYPYDVPLMTAINSELAFQPSPKSNQEIFLSLRHRCAFFGKLNQVDGAQVGGQWYMVGIRSWF